MFLYLFATVAVLKRVFEKKIKFPLREKMSPVCVCFLCREKDRSLESSKEDRVGHQAILKRSAESTADVKLCRRGKVERRTAASVWRARVPEHSGFGPTCPNTLASLACLKYEGDDEGLFFCFSFFSRLQAALSRVFLTVVRWGRLSKRNVTASIKCCWRRVNIGVSVAWDYLQKGFKVGGAPEETGKMRGSDR